MMLQPYQATCGKVMFELTEIMRQKDDLNFAQLLNRLRHNALTEEDKNNLKRCEVVNTALHYQKNSPHLFAENYFMHIFNDSIINSLQTEKVTVSCHDSVVSPNLSKQKQHEAITKLPTDPNKTANLHCSLIVVVGMIYDLTVNINTEDGLANGLSCTVKFIEHKQAQTNRPSIIWVEFDDSKIGAETRTKFKNRGFYHENINDNWTPIFDIERSFTYNKKTFQRIQFPMQPAAGRSVHRAQGITLDSVVVDLSQRHTRKVAHIHYVALSRVRSLKNLQILNFNNEALKLDEQVEVEMERLRNTAGVQLSYISFEAVDSQTHFKLAFNNCRSLHLHFDDIKYDQNLLSSHIIGLAETRLHQFDNNCDYQLHGYKLVRNDQETNSMGHRPPHGLAVYVKNDVQITSEFLYTSRLLEFILLSAKCPLAEIQIVVLYKSPSMSDSELTLVLKDILFPRVIPCKPVVVMGDFNVDLSKTSRNIIKKICSMFGCTMLINEPTTDNQSTLDLVFSNIDGTVGTSEAYWSDHKSVYFHT